MTLVGEVLPAPCRDAVGVFYNPSLHGRTFVGIVILIIKTSFKLVLLKNAQFVVIWRLSLESIEIHKDKNIIEMFND